jgi:hypothetical protein
MRCHTVLLATALTLTLAAGVDARDKSVDAPHVRPLNQASGALMAVAQQRSATVRDLFNKLEADNLVVYVNVTTLNSDGPESGLRFVGTSTVQRFVLISISDTSAVDRRIELLGHELQHAVDVAGTPWVTDDGRFQSLMTMVGWRDSSRARGYETMAANQTERLVRRDVRTGNGAQ